MQFNRGEQGGLRSIHSTNFVFHVNPISVNVKGPVRVPFLYTMTDDHTECLKSCYVNSAPFVRPCE